METIIFCITISLIMAAVLVGAGIGIGLTKYFNREECDKNNREDVRDTDNHSPALHSGTCDCGISSLGDVHGQEPCRCNMGSSRVKRLSNEDLGAFIRIFIHTGIRLSAGETEYLLEIADRLEGEHDNYSGN